ncbi:hypothetical protein QBC32DRAFT_322102 [Pseudoneurospora amorphoporcata]|uniref:Uncharacterized protein n=1 Tax=Pseudoneurospora amorphoporcata TaxID=241081 RepID=A0AAN6NZS2_9PEZI|nr:hypothetical protein QBC32DRAFT_322102 [Pseudoneurospora amorphoporcata]
MAAERDSPLPSVEPEQSLVVYNVEDFDTIMTNNTDITNGHIREMAVAIGNKHTQELTTLKEQYEILRRHYDAVTSFCSAGYEASQTTIARLEQEVQYGKKDAERQKAIDQLQKITSRHQEAPENLDERNARQQSILGRIDTWAANKESQINDILSKLVDPSQLKDLEAQIAQIASLQQSTQKAIQEAFIRSG